MGDYFLSRLEEMRSRFPFIKEVGGKGLILGMELKMEGASHCQEDDGEGIPDQLHHGERPSDFSPP